MTPRHLTVRQVAALLDRRPYTVLGWIRAGSLPAEWVGDGYRISLSALAALVETVPFASDGALGVRTRTASDTAHSGLRYDDPTGGTCVIAPPAPISEGVMPDLSTYLSLSDAATRIGRSTRTIRRWVCCGDLPRALRIKGRLLIHPGDLDELYRPANAEAVRSSSVAA